MVRRGKRQGAARFGLTEAELAEYRELQRVGLAFFSGGRALTGEEVGRQSALHAKAEAHLWATRVRPNLLGWASEGSRA